MVSPIRSDPSQLVHHTTNEAARPLLSLVDSDDDIVEIGSGDLLTVGDQLAQNDATIRQQVEVIQTLVAQNAALAAQIQAQAELAEDNKRRVARLEAEKINLERRMGEYRGIGAAQTVALNLRAPGSNSWLSRAWGNVKGAFNAAGQLGARNIRLIEAGMGATGAALAVVFAPFAVPILLGVTSAVAFAEWIANYYKNSLR